MQVYGDSLCRIRVATFASELLANVQDSEDVTALRATLIACGQLEQILCDESDPPEALRVAACRATEHAAAALYAVWSRANASAPPANWSVSLEVAQLRFQLAQLARAGGLMGTLKIPEGFAFYALYPEQYCAAATAYLQRHGHTLAKTHVIGLRSIGTTLSAAVAAVLRAARVKYQRYTVRPHGDPFNRELELPEPFALDDLALVIDEGPGLSGSSFFAAARALRARGVPVDRQAYFCAHPNPPGKMASAQISEFWQSAERYAAASQACALSAAGSFAETTCTELNRHFGGEVTELEDLSNGHWRRRAYTEASSWPAAYAAFERPKILAPLANGRRILLKFYGQVLRSDPVTGQLDWSDAAACRLIAERAPEVARIHGYVARFWIEGELLEPADKSPALLDKIAKHLAHAPLQRWGSRAADDCYNPLAPLAPRDWLRLPSGRISTLPGTLAGYDHTVIDAEPLGWDLASALVEWRMTRREGKQLLSRFRRHSGLRIGFRALAPHIQRYARFRCAQARLCAQQVNATEAARLEVEAARYASYELGSRP